MESDVRFRGDPESESVTACPPIHLGDGYVFISECYDKGSVVLKIAQDFSHEKIWENQMGFIG